MISLGSTIFLPTKKLYTLFDEGKRKHCSVMNDI